MISLNALKETYTTLKNDPALFTIDGKLISQDYHTYRIDKNRILKIIVTPFAGNRHDQPSWLVKILTKTQENIKRDGRIMIRGNASQAEI